MYLQVPTIAPVGAHLFCSPAPEGHVATYIGIRNGQPLCWTNDAGGHGLVSVVHPLWFEAHCAHFLVGWTEDNNGYDLGLAMDGHVAPQREKEPPPPVDPPSHGGQLVDALQHSIGAAIRVNDALIEQQPNRPLFRSIGTALSEQWANFHDAAT
jgi:hypothetical protein